ncbi:MAG: mechanosensitive ion channel domain-containing protein, partial [Pseudomonadales bacterium]|nr:mechanosensitive ion channel domain-containing protein [Pseudomonadales bacterium]
MNNQPPTSSTSNTTDAQVLDDIIPVETLESIALQAFEWLQVNVLTFDIGIQIVAIVAALVPAALFGPRLKKFLNDQVAARVPNGWLQKVARAFASIALPLALYLTLAAMRIAFGSAGYGVSWIGAAIALMNAWIVVRLVTLIIQSEFWSRVAFYIAWPIAALDAFGMLMPVIEQMQALAIPLGQNDEGSPVRISLFDITRTLFYFAVLFWAANLLSRLAQQQLDQIDEISPALKALIGKVLSVLLPVIALLIALQIVGFNLATLAVFSGAVGLGVGLGLQRIVANFVAGFTLIADKSIKPRDTIEVDGVMGWVTAMQARYVALRTRDGTEMLIPNDRFMSEGVINWSRSDRVVRLHAPFGISYSTKDLRAVQKMAAEAASSVDRVVSSPPPVCNLVEFGDSSVNFDLRFWITDPESGLANVRSQVLLNIWDALAEQGIEIPFPQRDL